MILALVILALAAMEIKSPRFNMVALGLFFWALAEMLPR